MVEVAKILPDLDDDVLVKIFKYSDQKTILQLMLVCQRFEFLVGQTKRFFQIFKLDLSAAKKLEGKSYRSL
jgi:hypothetical protein